MTALQIPKGVGYWDDGWMPLPTPERLVRPGWRSQELSRIVTYLQEGTVMRAYFGMADCRFRECGRVLGSRDRSDGEWIWPEGLEHYLTAHAVCLPESFVESMGRNGWRVPEISRDRIFEALLSTRSSTYGDPAHWIEWSREMSRGSHQQPPIEGEKARG